MNPAPIRLKPLFDFWIWLIAYVTIAVTVAVSLAFEWGGGNPFHVSILGFGFSFVMGCMLAGFLTLLFMCMLAISVRLAPQKWGIGLQRIGLFTLVACCLLLIAVNARITQPRFVFREAVSEPIPASASEIEYLYGQTWGEGSAYTFRLKLSRADFDEIIRPFKATELNHEYHRVNETIKQHFSGFDNFQISSDVDAFRAPRRFFVFDRETGIAYLYCDFRVDRHKNEPIIKLDD